ncbi:DUF4019 domain-containing protein [Pseudomonas kairouanensis]|uniref:DUF4019 domain-containing protein n=1 Tax=Pseudomonas kairouanensis TaxID=2293832 RepID=A0A4Z0AEN1_9PSED|nr:DUF4019 domain-containing protein [Pseudomonas kairouanensis]TFY85236.1 DUF4019 domain-containing protein [Pseudomonas kairouanensis]
MKHIFCAALFSMLLSGCDVSFNKAPPKALVSEPATEQQQRLVFDATVEFLQLLDSGNVDQTWPASSALLKATTSESMWTNSIKAMRLGLGAFVERNSANIGFTTQMPDVPAGRYAVVECVTTFTRGPATENIVLREDNNEWRVAGYSVNKRFFGSDDSDKEAP